MPDMLYMEHHTNRFARYLSFKVYWRIEAIRPVLRMLKRMGWKVTLGQTGKLCGDIHFKKGQLSVER